MRLELYAPKAHPEPFPRGWGPPAVIYIGLIIGILCLLKYSRPDQVIPQKPPPKRVL